MAEKEMELFNTGVLGEEIPVSNAVKVENFGFVGGSIGNIFGKFELVEGGIALQTKCGDSAACRPSKQNPARPQLAALFSMPNESVLSNDATIRSAGKRTVTVVPWPTSLCRSNDPP